MRLHRLTLQAFGPYPTHQVVDFDQLSGSGLFLLEGPTGAGKSSVLDAITFALYGELAGEGTGRDRLHSHFADPATTPEVGLEWSVRGRRMRVTRSPEHRRPRRRGEGTTTQAAHVHLEELRAGTWESVSANKAEVGAVVTDLMGLNRAQFTQVVLLPQGEFAQFLRADDDTRRALLTKLFGTHLYDRITSELDDRRRAAEVSRREANDHIAQALAAAGQAAGLDDEARRLLVGLGPDDLATHLADLGADLASADQQARVAAALARDELDRRTALRDAARSRAEQVRRGIEAVAALGAHDTTRTEHSARTERLRAARRAEPVRPLLDALADAEQARAEATAAVLDLCPDADASLLAGEGAARLTSAATAATRTAGELRHLVELEATIEDRRTELAELATLLADAEQTAATLVAVVEALPARRQDLADRVATGSAATGSIPVLHAQVDAAQDRLQFATELVGLGDAIRDQHGRARRAGTQARAADEALQDTVHRRIAGMSAELAAALVDGEPCTVCGSADHPRPAVTEAHAVTADDVEQARLARDRAESLRSAEDRELEALVARREALQERVGDGWDIAAAQSEVAALRAAVTEAQAAAARLRSDRDALAAVESELPLAQAELNRAAASAATYRQQRRAAAAGLDRDESLLAAARGGHPTVAAHHAELVRTAEHAGALAARLLALRHAITSQEREDRQARAEATAQGFPDVADALAATLDALELGRLTAQVEAWDRTRAGLLATVAESEVPGVDLTDAEGALLALEQAQQSWQQADDAYDAATRRETTTARTAAEWRQCLADLRRARAEQARTLGETAAVVRLAGLAKGTDGHRRVALTTYVLRHWFSQVVAAANLRLARMSAGRYELERSDEAESRAKRAGLTLTVIDRYTGERRHPRSLSGGETFFTSLALALGLAEVVKAEAGGVDLDTLFIDEGFGGLDAVTLDQVMEVIDELRDRGRIVGIVSHVADLKERIPERLEVRAAPDGSSTLRVVA